MARDRSNDVAFARRVIRAEMSALENLLPLLGDDFGRAVELLLDCSGRAIVTGIGKAGIIGRKISATLASTGTPSHFLHPVEAIHGDLGRVAVDDVVLALSNSGETEVADLLDPVKRIGARVIAMTGSGQSTLALHSDVVLNIGEIEEACPLGLAPSASTTAMLALGDALALAVANRRKFNKEEYALYHPGGSLGRKLLKVEDVMRDLDHCPRVGPETSVLEALTTVTNLVKKSAGRAPGAACVVDDAGRLIGIYTDGDLRRHHVDRKDPGLLEGPISALMIRNPKSVRLGSLAQEAAKILQDNKIDDLPVVDAEGGLCGIIDIQDLLAVRVIAS